MDKTWKAAERRVATFFLRKRNPLSGINSGHTGADVRGDEDFYTETKYRQNHAALSVLDEAAMGAIAEPGNRVPVVALVGARRHGFGVLIQSSELERFCVRFLRRIGYSVIPTHASKGKA